MGVLAGIFGFVEPNQVQQIIANLGINACHAIGRRQGLIEIQLDALQVDCELASTSADLKEGRYIRLRFTDNGSGIPDDLKAHLFDPFVTTKHNGTGLGLALVARVIGDHGGVIEFDSQPRRTVFRVFLPVVTPAGVTPTGVAQNGSG